MIPWNSKKIDKIMGMKYAILGYKRVVMYYMARAKTKG